MPLLLSLPLQFAWRPRPKSKLTEQDKADVTKNLGKYLKRFEREDGVRRKLMNAAANAEKLRALTEYRDMIAQLTLQYESDLAERHRLGLWKVENDTEYIEIEEVIEQEISCKESPYPPPR